MSATTEKTKTIANTAKVGAFIGRIVSFNTSLKLFHWHITGKGSYAQHISLDEAIDSLLDVTDRLTETSYSLLGDIEITVPETKTPENIVKHAETFFNYVGDERKLFPESYTQAILDDYQEAIQQLLYRLRRLQ